MRLAERARKAVKHAVFGSGDFPQQCVVGMRDPQQDIAVELHGLDVPLDVTNCHMLACAAPCAIGIGLVESFSYTLQAGTQLSLRFRARALPHRLLGKLGLKFSANVSVDGQCVGVFTVCSSRNYCLPAMRLWARYLHWAYLRRRQPPDVRMAALDVHAMPVVFICPRPVAVVSAADGEIINLFPMNLMGPLGSSHFGFALNSTRAAAALVKRAKRLALSSVPLESASVVRELGRNHKRAEGIHANELRFPVTASTKFGLPVPSFALRVRELEVATVWDMGSHTFFVGRIVNDEQWVDGPQFFMVHGIYQAWRHKMQGRDPLPVESAI